MNRPVMCWVSSAAVALAKDGHGKPLHKLTDTINFTFAGQGMVGIDAGASVLLPVGTGFDLLNVLSSNAVFRDFGVTLTMSDGRVTGWVARTTGTYRLATGAASALNGMTFSTVARPTGSGQFLLEITDGS